MANTISDLHVDLQSECLTGVGIGLCVTGGVASLLSPQLARQLRRFGARVTCYASESALRFVGRDALEWATGRPVEIDFRGLASHICREDALVVAPATANSLTKTRLGLCDELVPTLIQSALGLRKQVIFFPSMHDSLLQSPATRQTVKDLSFWEDVKVEWGPREEGKSKSMTVETMAQLTAHHLNAQKRLNRKCLIVTHGGTRVPFDSVRYVGNSSTGELGYLTAMELHRHGHRLTVIEGDSKFSVPEMTGLRGIKAPLFLQMQDELSHACERLHPQGLLHLAAVSDFLIENPMQGKLSSQESPPVMKWKTSGKLLALPSVGKVPTKIACKLTQEENEEGMSKALDLARSFGLDAVLWNSVSSAFGSHHKATLWKRSHPDQPVHLESKKAIALALASLFEGQDS